MRKRLSLAVLAIVIAAGTTVAHASGADLLRTGETSEKTGNRQAALLAYAEASRAPDLTDVERAHAFHRMGSIHGFLGENLAGISDFTNAIDLNPRNGISFGLRGYLRGAVGQFEAAEKDHAAAVGLLKNEKLLPWALAGYADYWRRRGEFDKALEYCAQALRVDPTYRFANFVSARTYLDMNRLVEAKTEFEKFTGKTATPQPPGGFWPDERGAFDRLRELH